MFTVNWTSPECTPQRTLQPLFSSTLPGDSVRMKRRYEQLELPLNETHQHHQSQQHRLPITLRHDWTNSGRARMKIVCDTTEALFIYSDQCWVERFLRKKLLLFFIIARSTKTSCALAAASGSMLLNYKSHTCSVKEVTDILLDSAVPLISRLYCFGSPSLLSSIWLLASRKQLFNIKNNKKTPA